jgi:hypothetical protein
MNRIGAACLALHLAFAGQAFAGETPSAAGAVAYFVNLNDGDTVKSPFKVIFGLSGMGIAPAGIEAPDTGHHHLFIDLPPLGEGADGKAELDENIVADEQHLHFGKGQTEAIVELPAGTHTLQLVLGDKDHIPHNPPVASQRIAITVRQ